MEQFLIKFRLVVPVLENSALNSLCYIMPGLSAFTHSHGEKHSTRFTQPVNQFHPYDWLHWVHQSTFSCKASSSTAEAWWLRNTFYYVEIILEVKNHVSGIAQKFTFYNEEDEMKWNEMKGCSKKAVLQSCSAHYFKFFTPPETE